jgi:phosphoenolpyruvate carboxykinase (GTP)
MLVPTIPGWTVRCVGDDIAWMHVGEDGKLYAINPHNGFYDGISGVSYLTSRATMDLTQANTIFINVAMTLDGDVWWEGMTKESPSELIDWTGQKWTPNCGRKAAHPNARYVTPMHQCPVLDPEWENPNGIPICAIIFGGRRSNLFPLITEAFTWEHGVFLGSLVSSDNSIFSSETVREPFAMVPYCAYNINMYFEKWLQLNEQLGYNAPKFFFVNWFRTDEKGNYLWPGFSENSRILKWICQRIESTSVQVIKTPLGFIPSPSDLDLRSLDMNKEKIEKLFHFEVSEWKNEIIEIQKLYQKLGFEIPESLKNELKILMEKIL